MDRPRASEADVVASAALLIAAVLPLPILESHKRDVVNGMLWSITQARGKYRTRFRSLASINAPKGTKLQHEHVVPRKVLVEAIMREPSRSREFLLKAVGCVVTIEEHRRLNAVTKANPELSGWERYRAAGIEWKDMDQSPSNVTP
jgi:hypothetical protein